MTSNNGRIRIAVLCGSVRPGNYTRMAVDVVTASLSEHPDVSVDLVDPSELDLPPPGLEAASDSVSELQEVVRGATAVILATPEYHGSFSSVMKLMIENLSFPKWGPDRPGRRVLPQVRRTAAAGLKDRRPHDPIQFRKLDVEVLGAPGERPRLIHTFTSGWTVSVARVQSIYHAHPLDDLTERGEPIV